MCDPESIANNPEKITEALGADMCIYVGNISPLELITGTGQQKIALAKRAREIAQIDDVNSIGQAISKLAKLIDGPNENDNLTTSQKESVAAAIAKLTCVYERTEAELDDGRTIRQLFDTYFEHQDALSETTAGHILRMAGDYYAIDVGFDFDDAWVLYQASLSAHEQRY